MKTLKDLDQRLIDFENRVAKESDLPTMRQTLTRLLSASVPKTAGESLDANQVLLKLRQTEAVINLENSEFAVLKKKVEANEAGMFQAGHGQVMAYLDACDKEKEIVRELAELK